MTVTNDLAVWRGLELVGVEFIDENGGGTGGKASKTVRPLSADSPAKKRVSHPAKVNPG
jgi:hypothetical protein